MRRTRRSTLSFCLLCRLGLLGLLAGALGAPVAAQSELVGDRPDFTESTETIARGHLQLEAGATTERGNDDAEAFSLGEALVRIGLAPRWELRVGVGSYVSLEAPGVDASGFEDSTLGFKVKLRDASGRSPAVALLGTTSLPTGGSEVSDDEAIPEARLALAWDLSELWSLGANLGYARPVGEDEERFDQGSWSLAAGRSLGEAWAVFFEVYGFSEEEPGGEATSFLDTGVTYLIHGDLQLDARIGVGLDDAEPEVFAGLGFVARW